MGVLLGSFLVGPLTEKFALGPLGITSLAVMSACYLLLPVVHSMLWAVCLLIVLAGIVLPSFNSSIIAYINASTPEHMIGRVHSVQGIPNMALTPRWLFCWPASSLLTGALRTRRCSMRCLSSCRWW